MRIGIDARPFKNKEFSGIPGAVYEVIKEWIENENEIEFYLISNTEIEIPCELPNNWKKVIVPSKTGNGTIWQLVELKGVIKRLGLDWYWGTNFMLPGKVKNCRYLLTVHDLAFEIMPEVVSKKTLLILKLLCKKSCKRADMIHAVSLSTKNDIIKKYNISPSKVSVVYWGADREKATDLDNVRKPLEYEYMLVLGTIEPRKNIETIVMAFNEFQKIDESGIHIVFAGRYGWNYERFKQLVEESPYKEKIHILDYVDNSIKEALLNNAKVLLYPSLYEGFGLPILEAYQHNLLVITANNSSIPEVAGEAAFYVENPHNYKEMAYVIKEVVNLDIETIENYKSKMIAQLQMFSWKKCSEYLMEIMNR